MSAALVAILMREGAAWSTLWFASAALAVAASLAVDVDGAARRGGGTGSATKPASTRPLSPDFIALIAAYGLFGFGYIITATFIVDMVRGSAAIAHLEPYIWVLFGLSAAPSVALWTRLGRSWGVLRTFAVASLVEAAGVACSALWLDDRQRHRRGLFVGGTFMGLTALGLIAARDTGGGDPRSDPRGRIALMTASFSAGQILGPAFAGYVYDATGSLAMPSLVAGAALVLAALLSIVADVQRRGAANTASASLAARKPEA